MNSQVVVNINSELKKKAMTMAKAEWLTMKALLSFLLKWYVEEKIEIWAKFTSFERDYGELEIEELSEEEIKIINSSDKLRNAPNILSQLLNKKWIM